MQTGQRKASYRRERDSLEGPHKEADIQHKALNEEKNLAFSKDACLEKERVPSKATPRKVVVKVKKGEVELKISLVGIHQKRDLRFAQIER